MGAINQSPKLDPPQRITAVDRPQGSVDPAPGSEA